jgi:hypothetical protein
MKKHIIIFLILLSIVLLMGFKSSDDIVLMLKLKTDQIKVLNEQITNIANELTATRKELIQLKTERKEDKFVLETASILTKGAVPSRWANPEHIRYVRDVCRKYEYIVWDIKKKEKLACWQFVFTRCLATGLDPTFHSDKDGNGKWDTGIADLNDVCLVDIQKDLPEHLKKANWNNIEKSIAGLYVWIKQRNRKMPWAELGYEQWLFYAKAKDE